MSTIHQAASKLKGRKKKKRLNELRSLLKSPQKRGVVIKSRIMSPKKPNSAKRKVTKVKLSTRFDITAKIKGTGIFLVRFNNVLVCGGRANDCPGVRYNLVKGRHDFSWRESFNRMNSRSKYGIKWDDYYWIITGLTEKIDEMNEAEDDSNYEVPTLESVGLRSLTESERFQIKKDND